MSISITNEKENFPQPQPLSKQEIKTFILSALGGALEFYDFVVYIYFATIMSRLFFDPTSSVASLILTYSVFASGYLARLLGGFVFSHYGDKNGRKNSFTFTVFLMAAPTFIIGLLPTYSQIGVMAAVLLFLCRFVQGLAIGGEIPCSITFIYEHAHKTRRGLACGILFSGVILGIFLGSGAGFLVTRFMTEESINSWGWRVPFLVGGILGLIGVYLRRFLTETPVFKKMKKENIRLPLKVVLKDYKFILLQTATANCMIATASALYLMYLPNYFRTYFSFKASDILQVNSICVFMYAILLIFFGILCDKIGARKVFNFSCVLFILLSFPAFALFSDNNFASIYFCYTFVAIAIAAASASGILLLAESYPAKVRYSGSSLSYNIAFGIFAGFTPLIVTTLIQKTELKTAPAFYMIAVSVVALFFSVLKDHKVHE